MFLLPGGNEYYETDACIVEGIVHIPFPQEYEKDIAQPVWLFLIDLLQNDLVKEINIEE